MNQDWGFGSYRQAIWLEQSRNLDPAYQRGYHALFKGPLEWSKRKETHLQRLTYALLCHIARRRTADIRKQKYGKRDRIGQAWRIVLEPLCYITGKCISDKK